MKREKKNLYLQALAIKFALAVILFLVLLAIVSTNINCKTFEGIRDDIHWLTSDEPHK